jgi:hypothetical protein
MLWFAAAAAAAWSLRFDVCTATPPLLALVLMPTAVICWLFLPPPYPGSIARTVTTTAAASGSVCLPRAFSGWSRVDLVRKAPASAVDGAVAELISQPGGLRTTLEIGDAHVWGRAEQTASVEFDAPRASAMVKIVAEGRWLVRAGEENHAWKDARLGWTVSRRARPFLCGSGALACVGLLVRCWMLIQLA